MKKEMAVIDSNGSLVDVEIISAFNLKETNTNYVVYTFNDTDDSGLIKIYVSKFTMVKDIYNFDFIDSDEEWNKIKNILKNMARGE